MCYSKEVQFTTGSIIMALSVYYYFYYVAKYEALKRKWLVPFLKYFLLGYFLIGGHQFLEFLSLSTESQWVYKLGLLISFFGAFFCMKSLEVLYNRDFKVNYFLIPVFLVMVSIFYSPVFFEAHDFYVRHYSVRAWSLLWTVMFFYFNFCAIFDRKYLKKDLTKKSVAMALFLVINFSFLISIFYVVWGYYKLSVNSCTDLPSVWCTFLTTQMFILPIFLLLLPRTIKNKPEKTSVTFREFILYIIITLLIFKVFSSLFPFSSCIYRGLAFS